MTPVNSARKMPEAFNRFGWFRLRPSGPKHGSLLGWGCKKTSPEEELMAYQDFFSETIFFSDDSYGGHSYANQ